MKIKSLFIAGLIVFAFSTASSQALIKIDDESVDLAIKYGIKSKDNPKNEILGSNWMNDYTGRTLNIYSPFVQIAIKAADQNTSGSPEEDLKIIKKRLAANITKVKNQNEIRFIIDIYGDSEDFAQKYKASIVDAESYYNSKNKVTIKPKKSSLQKVADKDNYVPSHPYSAVNCYTFKFEDLFKLKEYFFILNSESGEKIEYKINNQEIF